MTREFGIQRNKPSSKDDFFETIKSPSEGEIHNVKSSSKKSKPYRTHGFMIDLDMYDELMDYIDQRRMAGETKYSQRQALREAFELLFEHKRVDETE